MMQNQVRRCRQTLTRLIAMASLVNPRRVVRYFRSVSRRLDEITRLVHADSVARRDRDLRLALESAQTLGEWEQRLAGCERRLGDWEQQLREREQRVHEMIAVGFERLDSTQSSSAEALHSRVTECIDTIKSLRLDQSQLDEYERFLRYFRRQEYARAIHEGRLAVPHLETEHRLVVASCTTPKPIERTNDHPMAARFNRKLHEFLGGNERLRVLDLGCGGGAYVRSLLDHGHFAVGLEGSDDALVNQAYEWSTIPRHLFTCDVTKPFRLTERSTNEPLLFDAITAWGLLEHVAQEELTGVFENVDLHLAPGGVLLLSVATALDWDPATGSVWQRTVKPRCWWEERFRAHGFDVEKNHPFGQGDWLGRSRKYLGPTPQEPGDFFIALRRSARLRGSALFNHEVRALVA
jgi:2-polyprenyl-3-methyl-5-hydroxy-6-metoxy-1,4-benzoquinol methylase